MKYLKQQRHRAALFLIMLAAFFLSFYGSWNEGYSHWYYSAAVKSMLQSWHNFFFASFDPGGFITVDKPPLGLWLQVLSALIFGFHGWSLILVSALSTVISTLLIYHLVRRSFGRAAGLIAALVLALTPALEAVSRTNNLDACLITTLLLAAWALLAAAERGSLRLLLVSMFLVGLGYNIKMLQAFMVLPAFYLVYLLASPLRPLRKILHLSAGTVLLLAVSLSWSAAVDLTPADRRPYIGSSASNSVIELAIGYNGMQRILPSEISNRIDKPRMSQNGQNYREGGGPVNNAQLPEISRAVFRIFNRDLGGQIAWLIPLALCGITAGILRARRQEKNKKEKLYRSALLWLMWFFPILAYFSIAGFYHPYYTAMLAPAIAAMTGIGTVEMWKAFINKEGWKTFILPASFIITAAVQCLMLSRYSQWGGRLIPLVAGITAAAAIGLLSYHYLYRDGLSKASVLFASAGFAVLLAVLAMWAYTPVMYGFQNATLPYAGPDLVNQKKWGVNVYEENTGYANLKKFLLNNRRGEKFVAAVPTAQLAAPIILETGLPVMAYGGFMGLDNTLDTAGLEKMIKAGEIRYFLINTAGRRDALNRWVTEHGRLVVIDDLKELGGGTALYDLRP